MTRSIRTPYKAPTLLCLLAAAALGGMSCRGEEALSPTVDEAPDLAGAASAPLAFYQVSGGGALTCGVTMDNRAYCWGGGYLGNGTVGTSTAPVAVAPTLRFRQISAASNHTCAVTLDYQAYCWGRNNDGSVGDGTTEEVRLTPVPVVGGHRFRQIESGDETTCAVTYPDNRAYCWGYHGEGALGDGTPQPLAVTAPIAVAGGHSWRQVSTGGGHYPYAGHSCGVTLSDEAFCWGQNNAGQLGNGTQRVANTPSPVAGGLRFRQIDAGSEYTCGVTTDNRAFCWGNGRQGQIGDGKNYLRFTPRAVAGGHRFDRVTTGEYHTCAETTLNRAYCWGLNRDNSAGAVGDGTTTQRLTPVAVVGGLFFSQVSAGYSHTCGRTDAGAAYCWGRNDLGQLGDGTTTTRLRPVRVIGPR